MTRDMDLIRAILLAVEAHPDGFAPRRIWVEGYSQEQIGYHAYLLVNAGLCQGADSSHLQSSSPQAMITALTWSGHEFLDACRSPDIWQRAKSIVERLGGATLDVWASILVDLVRKSLGV
jgi:hypothetical protein